MNKNGSVFDSDLTSTSCGVKIDAQMKIFLQHFSPLNFFWTRVLRLYFDVTTIETHQPDFLLDVKLNKRKFMSLVCGATTARTEIADKKHEFL